MVEVAISGQAKPLAFANDETGCTALLAELAELTGLPVAVFSPRQARDFALAIGRLSKTNRIDAAVLADMAHTLVARDELFKLVKPLPDAQQLELQGLMTRRRRLMAMKIVQQGKRTIEAPRSWLPSRRRSSRSALFYRTT